MHLEQQQPRRASRQRREAPWPTTTRHCCVLQVSRYAISQTHIQPTDTSSACAHLHHRRFERRAASKTWVFAAGLWHHRQHSLCRTSLLPNQPCSRDFRRRALKTHTPMTWSTQPSSDRARPSSELERRRQRLEHPLMPSLTRRLPAGEQFGTTDNPQPSHANIKTVALSTRISITPTGPAAHPLSDTLLHGRP